MRLLKAQNTNLRNIYGKGVKYNVNGKVIMDSTNALLVPKGTGDELETPGTILNQRPAAYETEEGLIRYNTDTGEIEAYQNSAWRNIRYKDPIAIVQQDLGIGDGVSTLFGPLNSQDPFAIAPAAAQNVIVLVENVFQVSTTNYTLSQNPSTTGDGAELNATALTQDVEYIITDPGDTDFTLLGATDSVSGTVFTANGTNTGVGTGLVRETGYYLSFTSAPPAAGAGGGTVPIIAIHNFDK